MVTNPKSVCVFKSFYEYFSTFRGISPTDAQKKREEKRRKNTLNSIQKGIVIK